MKYVKAVLTSMLFCLALANAQAGEINLVTVDYSPFYGPSLPNDGPITEIVSESFKKVGYQVSVKYVPWARAMADAKAGKADGLHGGWYSKEREQWFVYSDKMPGNEIVLFKRKGTEPQSFTSYADLQSYRIGIVRGYRNPSEFDAANLRVEEADSDKSNLTKLAKSRVDLILVDRAIASYMLANELTEYADELEAVDPPLEILPLYLLISKKTDDYQTKVNDFNKGLKALTGEGGVDEIMKRHNLQ